MIVNFRDPNPNTVFITTPYPPASFSDVTQPGHLQKFFVRPYPDVEEVDYQPGARNWVIWNRPPTEADTRMLGGLGVESARSRTVDATVAFWSVVKEQPVLVGLVVLIAGGVLMRLTKVWS